MAGPIVLAAASAGLGKLAGVVTADRCSSSSSGSGSNLPLAGGAGGMRHSCVTCGGTGKVACRCTRWSDDVGCRPCAGTGRAPCRSCRGSGSGGGGRRALVRVAVRAQRPLAAVAKSKIFQMRR
ncbi:unnamed protein product [Urochloa decumbens]|uniref:Drought-induced protein 1 n=1 Tax=Urochloa decumbens TaxID=240449 RepID=A0ABC9CY87_9POAL